MPCYYSTDLRWRIVWLYYYKEKSFEEIEELLFVSSRSIRRYIDLFNDTGDVSPATQQHGPPKTLEHEKMYLVQSLMSKPDIYLEELRQELIQATGTDVSLSTICRTLKHLGFSRKKLRHIAIQRSEEKRLEFMEEMAYLSADMLVWTDECGQIGEMKSESMVTVLGGWHLSVTN